MLKFGLNVQIFILLLLPCLVYTSSLIEVLFNSLDKRLGSLENSLKTINTRLDKLEEVVEINDHEKDSGSYQIQDKSRKSDTAFSDLGHTKRRFMKAFSTEKHILREFISDHESMFDEFRTEIRVFVSNVNETLQETTKKSYASIVKYTNTNNERVNDLEKQMTNLGNQQASNEDEIKKLKRDIGDLTTSSKDGIKRLGNEIASLKASNDDEIKKLKSNIGDLTTSSKDGIKRLGNEIVSLKASNVDEIKKLESDIGDLTTSSKDGIKKLGNEIASLKELTSGFYFGMEGIRKYNAGSIVIFDHGIYQYGDGYDQKTGKFTAKTTGLYIFSVSVVSSSKKDAQLMIKDSKYGNRCRILSEKGVRTSGSLTCVIRVDKGTAVWVEAEEDSEIIGWASAFSGALISKIY